MKKFAAHFVFPICTPPIPKGIVKVDDNDTIIEVINPGSDFKEQAGLEFHNGIICPGIVNAFAELSLSDFFQLFWELKTFENLLPYNSLNTKDIFEWMKKIQLSRPNLSLERLISIFTLESAKAIKLDHELGSLSPKKKPGLVLIGGIDFQNMRLSERSTLKKLI